jgi:uncharacterized protein YjbI with pentapeptide repeats
MKTFVTESLVKDESYTSDSNNVVRERWLTLEVAPDVHFPIFVSEPDLVNADLQVGRVYEMMVKVSVFGESCYHTAPLCDADLNVIQRRLHAYIRDQASRSVTYDAYCARRAVIDTVKARDFPVRGIVLDPSWRPLSGLSFQVEDSTFRDQTFVLLETFWGNVLMSHTSLELNERGQGRCVQCGMCVEWRDARLDLLAVSLGQDGKQAERPQPIIIASNEAIIKRMEGLPLIEILNQGVEIWNEWVQHVTIHRPFFQEDDLSKRDLHGVKLGFARLGSADLSQSDLSYAHLARADLIGANLSGATLHEAHMGSAILSDANLVCADLSAADANRADLIGTNLSGATLCNVDLSEAILEEANLSRADLSGANLSGADLTGALLMDAVLDDVNLTGAVYVEEQLAQARSCENVRWS